MRQGPPARERASAHVWGDLRTPFGTSHQSGVRNHDLFYRDRTSGYHPTPRLHPRPLRPYRLWPSVGGRVLDLDAYR
ncbi:hypothetical protein ACFFX0_25205 [Citricoccus parietis]|uniref:Uncharacterized protein n=1 Tax=Citricoccus parietis TaxID=592307 RepID=A0ABV5G5U2_9MICC